jgi:DNA replication protein DnaC
MVIRERVIPIITRPEFQISTVVSTNLPFKQWGTVFSGAACVAALVDRFVQHCHVLDIEADSWRQTHPSTPPPPGSSPRRKARKRS